MHNIILYGKNEFYLNLNNKTYYIYKIDNKDKEKKMYDIFNKFIDNQNNNLDEIHYLGIDFEFNKISKGERDVALMQINIENNSNNGYIFVLYPPDLENKEILINLLTHKNIYKILHGSESLDIPYLFNQLLISIDNINNFCKNFYDTKYLCDYYNIENDITEKCSIYELLLNQKIIDQNKINELNKMNDIIGPLYLININIYKLNDNIFKYSLYDVIYLPELLKKFINKNIIYNKYISETLVLILKYKRNVENELEKIQKYINNLNLAYVLNNDNKIFLINIWEIYYYMYFDNNLININYFKKFFEIITKFLIYYNIINLFFVYKNNNQIFNLINYNKFISWFKNNYPNIFDLFTIFNNNIISDFKHIKSSLNKL